MNEIPMTKSELTALGWDELDFIIISGDALVDHPSFGVAIIARILLIHNYKVAVIAQPDWKTEKDFKRFGEPKLGFLVTSGNIDSMVNHYFVSKKRRKSDKYSPGGVFGKRPDRATIVYSKMCKKVYPNTPVIIGGIEASLRRFAHYDYWSNSIKKSILIDSNADLLIYGMADDTIIEVADALNSGLKIEDITYIRGTVCKLKQIERLKDEYILLPPLNEIITDKKAYAKSFHLQEQNTDPYSASILVEKEDDIYIIQNYPNFPLSIDKMDWVYNLPFTREKHSSYEKDIPALYEVKHSINANRGCFGGCSFCALTYHQGKIIQSRSKESILKEAKIITEDKEFKGYIHDVGGPTANFYNPSCRKQLEKGICKNKDCIGYVTCNNLSVNHTEYLSILRELRELESVKKVFIRSGIRYDYALLDKNKAFIEELVKYHVSGQLRIAPEHFHNDVLKVMRKPQYSVFKEFYDLFYKLTKQYDKEQYLVPYLISSHPGSTLNHAIELALKLKELKIYPEQVQDFYPTPGTAATAMYYSGFIPWNLEPVYIPNDKTEKQMQRALLQYNKKSNHLLVKKALYKAKREDLIGYGKHCLITP